MQITSNIAFRTIIIIGLSLLLLPGLKLQAQDTGTGQPGEKLSAAFVKPSIHQKAGELSFNIARIINHSDSAERIKPFLVLPDNWALLSNPINDTLVPAHDSISLIYRFKLPELVSSEVKYDMIFRAYSMKNTLLAESKCQVFPAPNHAWELKTPDQRVFFAPRKSQTGFGIRLENNGNITESIDLLMINDRKLEITSHDGWEPGQPVVLEPFQDTVLDFTARYVSDEDRVFDLNKIQFQATANNRLQIKSLMIEKYSDVYAPLVIDRTLPHQVELGVRTFSRNSQFLPFIKARGVASFKNQSTLIYNFNYYALTGNEDFISNSYYNFLYNWKTLKVGLGAFSSQLGRNMYTRNGVMVSNTVRLSPTLNLEAFLSQSIFAPKTSIATGLTYEKKKVSLQGSVAYDLDMEKKVNTGTIMLRSSLIPIFKHHDVSFNVYGYHETHDLAYDYTLMGFAYDFNYFLNIGDVVLVQLINNYGSPNVPGPQMGLLSIGAQSLFMIGDRKKYISVQYVNSSRDYYNFTFEGIKTPNIRLYDQFTTLFFHSGKNQNHIWEAGPSVESYISYRPVQGLVGAEEEFRTQKLRFEYKSTIAKNLTLNMKTGISNIHIIDSRDIKEQRYDFHLLGAYSLMKGFGFSFAYDYGPMVNSGLYQFAGDAKNHSINIGPSLMESYFKKKLNLYLFANFTYRFDLKYAALNINPKFEAYLWRDWYLVMSGTYHYTEQNYPSIQTKNSYVYLECSLKKRFGKSESNKWQKGTRQLRVLMFKDDNGNGVKDDGEQGIPHVKTRLELTNSNNPDISTQFPVDITLLSNEKGQVTYNQLPAGFYDLSITPLGDVKEYFYVSQSSEKLELTKNKTHEIPFQKATKIYGKLIVERQKFIRKGTEQLNLANIRITAYDDKNTYSSFTLEDGSFTIYVPGNNSYFIRMPNVFGSTYRIVNNDISIQVTDTLSAPIVFNVQEINRQVKFKDPKAAVADTSKQAPLKIKVLHGKFYENSSRTPVDKQALPEFNMKEAPVIEEPLVPGNHYVVIGSDISRTEAVKLLRIVAENGIKAHLTSDPGDGVYYVYSAYYGNKGDAREELARIKQAGLSSVTIRKF